MQGGDSSSFLCVPRRKNLDPTADSQVFSREVWTDQSQIAYAFGGERGES